MLRSACLAMLATAGWLAAQPPGAGVDIQHYRPHFLPPSEAAPANGAVRVTFLGCSSLLFDDGETQVLIDGFFSRPLLRKVMIGKIETDAKAVAAALKRAKADRVKAIFAAHSHYDHAFDVAEVARTTGATLHGSASTLNIGRGSDLPEKQLVKFEAGKEYAVGKFRVTVIASKHSPPIRGLNDDLGETIDAPLRQPAGFRDYKEGGSFDFVIRHDRGTIYVNPAANFVENALDGIRADVAFLSVGSLGSQKREFMNAFYDQTIGTTKPSLVIPVHWDIFFGPLSDELQAMPDVPAAFDFLIERLKADGIRFGIVQGYQSVLLFADGKK